MSCIHPELADGSVTPQSAGGKSGTFFLQNGRILQDPTSKN
jgi:hypothetical protein